MNQKSTDSNRQQMNNNDNNIIKWGIDVGNCVVLSIKLSNLHPCCLFMRLSVVFLTISTVTVFFPFLGFVFSCFLLLFYEISQLNSLFGTFAPFHLLISSIYYLIHIMDLFILNTNHQP